MLSSPLQQGSACEYNTGHTYTGGGAQSTGGDCTPAALSGEQRGIDVGKEMTVADETQDRIASVV